MIRLTIVILIALTVAAPLPRALGAVPTATPTAAVQSAPALSAPQQAAAAIGWLWRFLLYQGVTKAISHILDSWFNWLVALGRGSSGVGPDSKTEKVAAWLGASHNPLVVQLAAAIRYEESQKLPLSTNSLTGQMAYTHAAIYFCDDMRTQNYAADHPLAGFELCMEYLNEALTDNPSVPVREALDAKYLALRNAGKVNPTTGLPYVMPPVVCPQNWHVDAGVCRPCTIDPGVNACPAAPVIPPVTRMPTPPPSLTASGLTVANWINFLDGQAEAQYCVSSGVVRARFVQYNVAAILRTQHIYDYISAASCAPFTVVSGTLGAALGLGFPGIGIGISFTPTTDSFGFISLGIGGDW